MIAYVVVQTARYGISLFTGTAPALRYTLSLHDALPIYVYVAGSTEPASYTWSFGTAGQASGGIASYIGVNNTTPDRKSTRQNSSYASNAYDAGWTNTTTYDMLVYAVGITVPTTVNVPAG